MQDDAELVEDTDVIPPGTDVEKPKRHLPSLAETFAGDVRERVARAIAEAERLEKLSLEELMLQPLTDDRIGSDIKARYLMQLAQFLSPQRATPQQNIQVNLLSQMADSPSAITDTE